MSVACRIRNFKIYQTVFLQFEKRTQHGIVFVFCRDNLISRLQKSENRKIERFCAVFCEHKVEFIVVCKF